MNNDNKKKNEIAELMEVILNASHNEDTKFYEAIASYKKIQNSFKYAKNGQYEEFEYELQYPINRAIDGLLQNVTDCSEAKFLLKHSNYVERHFRKLITKHEGMPCSADKSRTILRSLINFYLKGKRINFDYEQEVTYHLPKQIFKAHDEIVDFFTGVQHLYYGNPEKYLIALANIEIRTK